jgi:hypothetical protein
MGYRKNSGPSPTCRGSSKTFQTSQGFYDLAIAAPSMKAALEAWGASSNLFHQGFAKEVDDEDVIAATMENRASSCSGP